MIDKTEKWKVECDYKLEGFRQTCENARSSSRMMIESTISSGANAVRAMLLVNGGASVATLALLDHLYAAHGVVSPLVQGIRFSLLLFGIGVALGAGCAGTTYFTQLLYTKVAMRDAENMVNCVAQSKGDEYKSGNPRMGRCMHVVSILLGAASFVLFCAGMWQAYMAFPGA